MTETLLAVSAFFAGLVAGAPLGPVNMVAIRRGLITHWMRVLWVGTGCVLLEALYIALGFWGGAQVTERLATESLRRWVGLPGAAIILAVGILVLRRAFQKPRRPLATARPEQSRRPPTGWLHDLLAGAALTLINPAVLLYWLSVGSRLVVRADLQAGDVAVWYGVAAAVAGLIGWFCFIALLIRLRPQRVSPNFFRAVNGVCGALLTATGIFLGVRALR